MKIDAVPKILTAILILALLSVSTTVVAASSITSGFAKIRDWDKTNEAFNFSSGQVTSGSGDFFIAPSGIHVFNSPGIIDMGIIDLDAVTEAPASGYMEMAPPIDGHSYVVRSNGKYGKFYIEETYDWLNPVEYGIRWAYQTNGTRSLESTATSGGAASPGQTGSGGASGCTYEQYIAAYNKLTSLMAAGKGDTSEAKIAYDEFAKMKACYESTQSGTGSSNTTGQTGTGGVSGCTYQDYITAYNKLNYLNSHGQANTPESKLAYEQYVKIKACYESTQSGTGSSATTGTSEGNLLRKIFYYPYTNWIPYQNGQGTVSLQQSNLCINSMKTGGAWAETPRLHDISTDYTVELDFKVTEKDNHYIIIYSDGYLHLDIDWGTALSHHQPGAPYSLRQFPGNLQLNQWYKIKMNAYPSQGTFDVYIDGSKVSTATGLTATNISAFHSIHRLVNCTDCIFFGDPDDSSYNGGTYNRGSACWRNISVTGKPKGTTPQTSTIPATSTNTATTTTTTTTTAVTATPAPAGTTLIAESRTTAQGNTVQVPVYFQNASNVGSLGFKLNYNPAIVQVIKVSKGSLMSPATFTSNVQSDYIIFGFATPQNISGTGSAAIVEFKAIGGAGTKSPLTLSEILATSSSGSTVSVNASNGELSIGQKQVGDGNGDGKISVLDALLALKMYVQLLPVDLILDVNKDGRITPEDARLIVQMSKPK